MSTHIDDATMARIEAAAKERWQSDAALRDDFVNDEASYLAFCRFDAMGCVRICGPGPTSEQATPRQEAATEPQKPTVDPNLPVEDRCKAEWQHDPQIRSEFQTVEDYIAYAKANERGHVHIRKGAVR